jgi:hypothetical protein
VRRLLVCAGLVAVAPQANPPFRAVVLPVALRDSMSAIWKEGNRHWDELADVNTLTQMIGTGHPTQREYLGCLAGRVDRDTLWIERLAPAADLRQLQFAVSGSCNGVAGVVGTWHTHPYRADSAGSAVKERGLSTLDLTTFADAKVVVMLVVWDADSLDVAAKDVDGSVRHPLPLVLR